MSPLRLEILLHYYHGDEHRGGDFVSDDFSDEAVSGVLETFCTPSVHMLEKVTPTEDDERSYRLTPRGEAFVKHICAVPLPSWKGWVVG